MVFMPRSQAGLPLVIAHRGASGIAPENTLLAATAALTLGADMVEVDLQLSRDGHLVLFHDPTLRRTARCPSGDRPFGLRKGRSVHVADLTLQEIKRLDAGSWYGRAFAGLEVPTLTELLEHCAGRVSLNLELKVPGPPDAAGQQPAREAMASELCRVVDAYRAWDSVLISSLNNQVLASVRARAPHAELGLVVHRNRGRSEVESALLVADRLMAFSLHLPFRLARPALIAAVHQKGYRLYVYTVNQVTAMRRLIAGKVDGIMTDYPDRLAALLGRSHP